MATKQEIDKGQAINMGGSVPAGHCLLPIRRALLDNPRGRQWIIGQVVNSSTKVDHPADADDRSAPTIQWVDMTAIIEQADCDQLEAMAKRARQANPPPGQGRLEDFDDPHGELGAAG